MNRVIREKRLSVSENSPTLSAFSVATISLITSSFCSALALTTRPSCELEPHALDDVAVAIERLVEVDPALRAAPVGAREDLEARDVATAAANPLAALPQADKQIDIIALDVQALDLRAR